MSGVSALSALGPTSNSYDKGSPKDKTSLSMSDFYSLIAAQIKYQDADNPADTSQMMAQMVQTQMIQAINQMSSINLTTYASSMVGKEVTMAEVDEATGKYTGENTTGVITGVLLGDNPVLFIGDKGYYLSQMMTIGKVPESATNPDEDKDPEDETKPPETPGEGDGEGGA